MYPSRVGLPQRSLMLSLEFLRYEYTIEEFKWIDRSEPF